MKPSRLKKCILNIYLKTIKIVVMDNGIFVSNYIAINDNVFQLNDHEYCSSNTLNLEKFNRCIIPYWRVNVSIDKQNK